jgi:hypothetical protein
MRQNMTASVVDTTHVDMSIEYSIATRRDNLVGIAPMHDLPCTGIASAQPVSAAQHSVTIGRG